MLCFSVIYFKENGWSAIFFAAKKADMPMSQLLCESGANLDLVSKVWSYNKSISLIVNLTFHVFRRKRVC